jgi:hypothetical protein
LNRTARGALIGGAVGALVAVAQTVRAEDDPQHVVAVQAVRGAAQGALVGALVGWVLDRTSTAKATGVAAYAEVAREALSAAAGTAEQAYGAARPRVEQVYETARPRVEHAVEVALPVVEQAAELARERATDLASDLAEAARRRVA